MKTKTRKGGYMNCNKSVLFIQHIILELLIFLVIGTFAQDQWGAAISGGATVLWSIIGKFIFGILFMDFIIVAIRRILAHDWDKRIWRLGASLAIAAIVKFDPEVWAAVLKGMGI